MRNRILAATLAIALSIVPPPRLRGGEAVKAPPVRVDSYDLTVNLLAGSSPFEARAAVSVRNVGTDALDSLTFYLHSEFKVEEIRGEGGQPLDFQDEVVDFYLNFNCKALKILVRLPAPLEPGETSALTISYKGKLTPSTVRSRSDGCQGISGDLVLMRGFAYCLWFPVVHSGYDGVEATAEFRLTLAVPTTLRPIAFGRLVSERVEGAMNHSVWETSRPLSLLWPTVMAAPWQEKGNGDLRIYVYDAEEEETARVIEICADIGGRLLEHFRRYYGQDLAPAPFLLAEIRIPSGAVGSGNGLGLAREDLLKLLDRREYNATIEWLGHEMVHEYVVAAVRSDAPGAAVIAESFPLYFHLPMLSRILGPDFQKWWLTREWRRYERGRRGGADDEGPLPKEKPLAAITLEELPQYKDRFLISDKALIVFDHLRRDIGDEAFFRAVAAFLAAHRTEPGTLADFEALVSKEAGRPMRDFFHRWFETTEVLPQAWRARDTGGRR